MASRVLLEPLYLLGLVGVAVPIVIHLYGRRRRREVQFPSLQLLQATQQRQRSFVRLRSLLVLMLRILAIVCFVLALARPVARGLWWASAISPTPASVAVVIDDSLSMGLRVGTETVFGRAQDAADAILAALRSGDDAVILLASGTPTAAGAHFTADAASARRGLRALQPSQRAVGLAPAIGRACDQLAHSSRPARHMYIVTDLQASSWEGIRIPHGLPDAILAATVVDVGAAESENWAIERVAVTSPLAFVSRPVRLRADIRHHGGKARKRVAVWLGDAGPSAGTARSIELPPNGSGSVELVCRPKTAGDVGITVRLQEDCLPQDNERFVVLRVREWLDVLCVEAIPDVTRFLRRALRPPGGESQGAETGTAAPEGIHTDAGPAAAVSRPALRGRDLVVLANVPRLTHDQTEATLQYLRAGGGLLVFLGDRVDAAFYNEALLPQFCGEGRAVELVRIVGDAAERRRSFAITDFAASRAPLAAFADPSAGDLTTMRFFALWEIALAGHDTPTVLARFDNGLPAMLEACCGAGRAIIVNTTADDAWTDAPRRAVYVPLVHRLCYHLARDPDRAPLSLVVGDDLADLPDKGALGPPTLYGEAGTELADRTLHEDASRLNSAGIYRAAWADEHGPMTTLVAVNVDPTESSTERMSPREVAEKLHPIGAQVVSPDRLTAALRGGTPRSIALSLPLLLLAIGALVGELLLGRRRSVRASGGGRL